MSALEYLQDLDIAELFGYFQDPLYQGLAITLGVLIALFVFLRKSQPANFAAFNATSGKVLVSRTAINDIVKRTCDYTDFIDQSKVRINTRKRNLDIRLFIRLKPGAKLSNVATSVQKNLEVNLRKNIGIENLGKIDVIVTGISGSVPAHLENDEAYDETITRALPEYSQVEYISREELDRRDERIRELEAQMADKEPAPEKTEETTAETTPDAEKKP